MEEVTLMMCWKWSPHPRAC